MRIALLTVWIGEIPSYLEYHLETCRNLGIDFIFLSDREISFDAKNFRFERIELSEIESRLEAATGRSIAIESGYKLCDLKPGFADIFSDYLEGYDFVGYYDVDTLFGDLRLWLKDHFENDIISFGEADPIYNRISGPLVLMRNEKRITELYKNDPEFYSSMSKPGYDNYDEEKFTNFLKEKEIKYKIIHDSSNIDTKDLRVQFDAIWSGGKVYCEGSERMLHHFYYKNHTEFQRSGNSIIAKRKKIYDEDFVWVTYFTESYERLIWSFVRSVARFSTRKCILYTVNYDSKLVYQLSDQFIIRRIDLGKDDKLDAQGRSLNVLTLKPEVLLDSVRHMPHSKFVYCDTDVYLTATADDISKYFSRLNNYPLVNSHVHDRLLASDVIPGEWVSTLDVLSEESGIPIRVFPRRKANFMLYDARSDWFFQEQLDIYYKHKDSPRPGIFRLHDEDMLNIILSKFDLQESLPVIDMEESSIIDMNKFFNYSYHRSQISQYVKLPEREEEVLIFHGFKDPEFYKSIESDYLPTVLDPGDIVIDYVSNDLLLKRTSLMRSKKIERHLKINIQKDGNQLYQYMHWDIFSFHTFAVWGIQMSGDYEIILEEVNSGRKIYKNKIRI
jgi:hypothetical protein